VRVGEHHQLRRLGIEVLAERHDVEAVLWWVIRV
jgi:hypothetical protein